jgi:hypothetical protein
MKEPYYYIVGQNLTFEQLAEEVKSIYGMADQSPASAAR